MSYADLAIEVGQSSLGDNTGVILRYPTPPPAGSIPVRLTINQLRSVGPFSFPTSLRPAAPKRRE